MPMSTKGVDVLAKGCSNQTCHKRKLNLPIIDELD